MRRLIACVLTLSLLMGASPAFAVVWGGLGTDGLWTNTANWSGAVPNGQAAIADFTADTANATIDLTSAPGLTVGSLIFGLNATTANAWTLDAALTTNTLTLDNGGSAPTITVNDTVTATINSKLLGSNGFTKDGAGTLNLTNVNTLTGGITLSAGVLRVGDNAALGSATVTISNAATLAATDATARSLANNFVLNADTTFGQTTGGTGALTISGAVDLGGGAPRTLTVLSATTLSGVVSNGALTKAGAATLTLGGAAANTFTGTTTVTAGTLTLNKADGINAIAGDIFINGGNLQLSNNNQIADTANITISSGGVTWSSKNETFASLTMTDGTILSGNSNNGQVTVTGAVTTSGAATFSLNSGGQWTANAFNLGSSAPVSLGGNNARVTQLNVGSGGLNLTGQTITLNSQSPNAGTEINLGGNVTSSGTSALNVGTASGKYDLNLGAASRTFDITADTLTVNARIVGDVGAGIIKTGAGTLALGGANTFTGAIVINQGVLSVSADSRLGNTANTVSLNGGTLRTTASLTTNRVLTLSAGPNAIDVTSGTFTANGAIGGTTGFTKTGAGALTLGTANSFVGTLVLAAGTVNVSADNQMGDAANTLSFTGGTLGITTGFTSDRAIALGSGIGAISVATGQTFQYTGVISGSATLQKTGAGTLELTGTSANLNTSPIDVRQGFLRLNRTGVNAINSSGLKIISSSAGAATVQLVQSNQIDDAATVAIEARNGLTAVFSLKNDNVNDYTETIGGLTILADTQAGAVVQLGKKGVLTVAGDITFYNDKASGPNSREVLITSDGTRGTTPTTPDPDNVSVLNLGGAVRTIISTTNRSAGSVEAGNNATIEVIIANGGIIKEGSRALYLSRDNTYALATTINAGMVSIKTAAGIGNGAATNDLYINNGATLQTTATMAFSVDREVILGAGGGTFDVASGTVLTLPGLISSAATPSPLIKTGAGTLALTGVANTFTGDIDIRGGVVSYAADASLGNAGNAVLLGGLLNASEDLTFARSVTLNAGGGFSASTNRTLTVNSLIGNGAGSALAIGTTTNTGTVALTQANTYTGATTVTGGTVVIAAANNLGDGSATNTLTLTAGRLRTTADIDLGPNRALTLGTGTNFLDVADTKTLTVSGVVGGTGSLTKEGLGKLVISGAGSAISGQYRPTAGITDVTAVPNIFQTGTLNLVAAETGTIDFGAATALSLGGLIGDRAFDYGTRTLTLGGNNTGSTYTAILSGTGNITKTGTANQVLGGANTYTGLTNITQGTLTLRSSGASFTGNIKIDTGATLQVDRSPGSTSTADGVFSTVFGAAANTIELHGGTLKFDYRNSDGSDNTSTVDRTLLNRQILVSALGGTFNLPTGNSVADNADQIRLSNAAGILVGTGPLTKTGFGRLTLLSNSPAYSGAWTVSGGVLEAGGARLGDASATNTVTVNSTNNANWAVTADSAQNVTLNGGTVSAQGTSRVLSGAVNVTAASRIGLNDFYQDGGGTRNLTISGILSGSANLTVLVTRSGYDNNSGKFILTNPLNDYSGTITVQKNLNLENNSTTGTGKTLGTAAVALAGGHLRLLDNGTGSNQQLAYGTNVTVTTSTTGGDLPATGATGVNAIHVDRKDGTNTGNTFVLGTLAIGAQTLDVTGGNGYTAAFAGLTTLSVKPVINATTGNLALVGGINTSGAPTSFGLDKSGAGALVIGGANYDSGPVNLTGGTLAFLEAGSIGGTGATITTAAGTTVAAAFATGPEISQANFLDRIVNTSAGVIALGSTTTQDLDLTAYASARLGAAIAGATSGSVIFAPAGGVYRLGGGGGVLTLSKPNVLTGTMALDIDSAGTAPGIVALTAANDFTGAISLKGGQMLRPQTNASLGNAANVINSDGGGIQFAAGAPFDLFQARTVDFGAGGFTLDTNGNDYTPAVVVTGNGATGAFTKAGAGTLNLGSGQTFTGPVNINGGVVKISAASGLGLGTGAITLGGGTLQTTADMTLNRTIAVVGMTNALFVDANTTLTLGVALSGGAGSNLTKTGPGALTLTADSTTPFANSRLTIAAGTVNFSNPNQLGNANSGLTLAGGTLNLAATSAQTTSRAVTLDPVAGNVISVANTAGPLTFSGAIGGAGGFTKTGPGTAIFSGTNTFTGGFTINEGVVRFDSAAAFNNSSVTLAGGTLRFNRDTATDFAGAVTVAADSGITVSKGTANTAGTTHTLGALNLGAQTLTVNTANVNSGVQTLAVSGATTLSGNAVFNVVNPATGTANLSLGVVAGTGFGFTKQGAGTLTLTAANTYTGATTVSAGVLSIAHAGALATTSGVAVNSGARLDVAVANFALGSVSNLVVSPGGFLRLSQIMDNTLGATVPAAAIGGLEINNAAIGANFDGLQLANGATVTSLVASANYASDLVLAGANVNFDTAGAGGSFSLTGVVSGAGNGITKLGANTLTLGGGAADAVANTFTGVTTVNAGVLLLDKQSSLGGGGGAIVGDGNTATSDIIVGGTGTLKLNADEQIANTATITLNAGGIFDLNGKTETLFEVVPNGGSIQKNGGMLNLSSGDILVYDADTLGATSLTRNMLYVGSTTAATVASLTLTGASHTINVANGTAADDLTISGVIAGAGSNLVKSGAGRLVLSAANTFGGTGNTFSIEGGPVAYASTNEAALGDAATTVIVRNGGTLAPVFTGTFTPARLPLIGNGGGGFDVASGNTITIAANMANVAGESGPFLKTGAGTVTLSGANTFASVTVTAGVLKLHGSATTNPLGTGVLTIAGGVAELRNNSSYTYGNHVNITGAGVLVFSVVSGSTPNMTLSIGDLGQGGTGALTLVGNLGYTLTVANVNLPGGLSYGSATNYADLSVGSTLKVASGGTVSIGSGPSTNLRVAHKAVNPTSTSTLIKTTIDATAAASFTVNVGTFDVAYETGSFNGSGATIGLLALPPNASITAATRLSVGDSNNQGTTATLQIGGGATTITTPIFMVGGRKSTSTATVGAGGTLTIGNGAGRTQLIVGQNNTGTGVATSGTFDLSGAGDPRTLIADLQSVIVGEKTSGSSSSGGRSTGTWNLGSSLTTDVDILNASGTALLIGHMDPGNGTATPSQPIAGTVTFNAGALSIVTTDNTLPAVRLGWSNGTFNGTQGGEAKGIFNITGGNVSITNNGTGPAIEFTPTHAAANTANRKATGELNISGGNVSVTGPITVGTATDLGVWTSTIALSGGLLNMNSGNVGNVTNFNFTGGTLRNLGTLARPLAQSGAGSLLDVVANSSTITGDYTLADGTAAIAATRTLNITGNLNMTSGAINGPGAVSAAAYNVQAGTVSAALGGASVGLTKTTSGTLLLNGVNTYSGPTDVQAGTLGGGGAIAGAVTVQNGATLNPGGAAPGTLTINNTLTFNSTANAVFDLVSLASYDKVVGVTTLTYGGTLQVNVGPTVEAGVYDLFAFTAASGPITFTPPSLPAGYSWKDYGSGVYFNAAEGEVEIVGPPAGPVNATWTATAAGSWATSGNWSVGIPDGQGTMASFTGTGTGSVAVTVAGAQPTVTVGRILFNQAAGTASYTLSGAALTLDNTGNTTSPGIAKIEATAGVHEIASQVKTATAGTDLDVTTSNAGRLSLTGGIDNVATRTVTLSQTVAGPLTANALTISSIANEGTLVVKQSGSDALGYEAIRVAAGIDGTGDTTVGTTGGATTATLITEHIRQDVLTINAGSKVKISATGGASSTSVVNVLNIANAGGSFNWSSFGGDISPAATGGPVASGAAVPEPATWLLAVIAALAGLVAWRRRQ